MAAAFSCECLLLSLSIPGSALGFFMLILYYEPSYIYFIDIDLCCFLSKDLFWPYLIDSKLAHPDIRV